MGFFSKVKKKIKKAIPKEIAPFLPALASIYGGPALAGMFGGLNPILAQGLGAALADAGTQELTSDRTRLESSLFSGIMGGVRGSSMLKEGQLGYEQFGDASKLKADAALAKATNPTQYATDLAAGDYGTGFQRSVGGLQDFANASNMGKTATGPGPFSIAGASNIAVTASPKLGYNEAERLSKDLASQAAASAKARGLSYDESMEFANQYFYGSNPGATEAEYNAFMEYYNSDLQERLDAANGGRIGFADGSEEGLMQKLLGNFTGPAIGAEAYMGDVYGDRDRDSLDMKEFYKEYPETQVGSYINENRYKSEKIEKLEAKLNEIIDMRQRTADRSRNPENDGMPSLMEKLLDKEINSLYADRTNDDVRKSEAQKRDEMNARFDAQNAEKQQMIQDYYNNLGVYARPGRAMGGMMNAGMMNNNMMNPRMGYANGSIPDRPNFNYGSGRQTPQGDPIAPNMPPGMQMDLRPGGFIELGTEPRADDVPAMVGKDEFVLNDRAVAGIGKALTGRADPRAGARALYDLQSQMEATV